MKILPPKDEYIDQCCSNEFYDIMISFRIRNKIDYLDIGFGIPININKLSDCIKERKYEEVEQDKKVLIKHGRLIFQP